MLAAEAMTRVITCMKNTTLVGPVFATMLPFVATGAEDALANRPAFSLGDQPAAAIARCTEVRAMSAGLDYPGYRVDLSVVGEITSVRTDGVLWYVTMCNLPDVRLMCVTYKSNDMKVGDRVFIKGGYNRLDANHIKLDPCLANQPEAAPAD
jgi:hypothetical protein